MPVQLIGARLRVTFSILLSLVASALLSSSAWALSTTPDPTFAQPNGPVLALGQGLDAQGRNVEYIGGQFNFVGPTTGSLAEFDPSTGLRDTTAPVTDGTVSEIIPDGNGGYFLAGSFSTITPAGGGDPVPRAKLAHILASGAIDPAFSISATGSAISTLALSGQTLYIGGAFTAINGAGRTNLAAVDTSSGALLSWNPSANSSVRTLAVDNGTLYVGGLFSTIAGTSRSRAAAFNIASGSLTTWNPNITGYYAEVSALLVEGGRLLAGGRFTAVGASSRTSLASFDLSDGSLQSWSPAITSDSSSVFVNEIEPGADRLYIGGNFNSVDGQTRTAIAAFDAATLELNSFSSEFDPFLSNSSPSIKSIVEVGGTLYVGGNFGQSNDEIRANLAAINVVDGSTTAWQQGASGQPSAMTVINGQLLIGGSFNSLGGVARTGAAAIDMATGQPTDWNPQLTGGDADRVRVFAVQGDRVYIGGHFQKVGGVDRRVLVSVDNDTGAMDDWDPDLTATGVNSGVHALRVILPNQLIVGGHFWRESDPTDTRTVAMVDTYDGHMSSWHPDDTGNTGNRVWDFEIADDRLYVARDSGLLACDLTSGENVDLGLEIGSNAETYGVDAVPEPGGAHKIYFTGYFDTINGEERRHYASITEDGTLLDELPANGKLGGQSPVYDVIHDDSKIYFTGYPMKLGGVEHLAMTVDRNTLQQIPWNPSGLIVTPPFQSGTSKGWKADINGDSLVIGHQGGYAVYDGVND